MSLALRFGHVISVKIRLGCKSCIDFDYDVTGHPLITHHFSEDIVHVLPSSVRADPLLFSFTAM